MRLLHTADWHLGRVFHRVNLIDQQQQVLGELRRLVRELRPDVLLVAGDVYDRAVPPAEAVALLDETLMHLVVEQGVPTVVIAGNHDSTERLAFGSRLLAQQALHVFGPLSSALRPVVVQDGHGPVHIHAVPYPEPAAVRRLLGAGDVADHRSAMRLLLQRVRDLKSSGVRSVLVGHALAEGGRVSESERPLTLADDASVPPACFEGFDYVALGHLHRPQEVGSERVQYSGSIYPYSFSEADDEKSVTLVEPDARGGISYERYPLPLARRVRVIEGTFAGLLQRGEGDERRADFLRVRLLDTGPIVGAIARLRDVYPNVLEAERPFLTRVIEGRVVEPTREQRGEMEQFEAFFEYVTGHPLGAELAAEFQSIVSSIVGQARDEQDRGRTA